MIIVNPNDDSVLTLKPEMRIKERKNYIEIIWEGVIYDNGKQPDIHFAVNLSYDDFIDKVKTQQFIVAEWKEIMV